MASSQWCDTSCASHPTVGDALRLQWADSFHMAERIGPNADHSPGRMHARIPLAPALVGIPFLSSDCGLAAACPVDLSGLAHASNGAVISRTASDGDE